MNKKRGKETPKLENLEQINFSAVRLKSQVMLLYSCRPRPYQQVMGRERQIT